MDTDKMQDTIKNFKMEFDTNNEINFFKFNQTTSMLDSILLVKRAFSLIHSSEFQIYFC